MPFDWGAFIRLARALAQPAGVSADPEACLRSSVSRAYFGAYCHARNYAKDFLNFNPREDADDHGRLRAHLKGKRRKGDADRLDQLRLLRNQADYQNELNWTAPDATVAGTIASAERVFQSLVAP